MECIQILHRQYSFFALGRYSETRLSSKYWSILSISDRYSELHLNLNYKCLLISWKRYTGVNEKLNFEHVLISSDYENEVYINVWKSYVIYLQYYHHEKSNQTNTQVNEETIIRFAINDFQIKKRFRIKRKESKEVLESWRLSKSKTLNNTRSWSDLRKKYEISNMRTKTNWKYIVSSGFVTFCYFDDDSSMYKTYILEDEAQTSGRKFKNQTVKITK